MKARFKWQSVPKLCVGVGKGVHHMRQIFSAALFFSRFVFLESRSKQVFFFFRKKRRNVPRFRWAVDGRDALCVLPSSMPDPASPPSDAEIQWQSEQSKNRKPKEAGLMELCCWEWSQAFSYLIFPPEDMLVSKTSKFNEKNMEMNNDPTLSVHYGWPLLLSLMRDLFFLSLQRMDPSNVRKRFATLNTDICSQPPPAIFYVKSSLLFQHYICRGAVFHLHSRSQTATNIAMWLKKAALCWLRAAPPETLPSIQTPKRRKQLRKERPFDWRLRLLQTLTSSPNDASVSLKRVTSVSWHAPYTR